MQAIDLLAAHHDDSIVGMLQDAIRGEHHVRQPDGSWLFREFTTPGQEIELKSIGCRLRLDSLYERVEFEA